MPQQKHNLKLQRTKEPDAPVVHTSPKPEIKKHAVAPENAETKKVTDKPVVNTPPKPVKAQSSIRRWKKSKQWRQ